MTDVVGGSPSINAAMKVDLGSLRMQVTPENVLQVHNALLQEARGLDDKLQQIAFPIQVGVAAKDPVSKPAADGFNAKIDKVLVQCHAYVDALNAAATELAQMAKKYGHTEDEIKTSFTRFQNAHLRVEIAPGTPPPAPPPQARTEPDLRFPGIGFGPK